MATTKIFNQPVKLPFLFLLIAETCVLFSSIYAAAFLRLYPAPLSLFSEFERLLTSAGVIALITPIAMLSTGLYQGKAREGLAGILMRLAVSFAATAAIIAILSFSLPDTILGRGIISIAFLLSFFIIGTLRAIFSELIDSEKFKKRVLIFGAGNTALHIDKKLRRKVDRRGFEVIGYIPLEHQTILVDSSKLIHLETSLLEYSRQWEVDEIVIAISDTNQDIPVTELVNCKLNGVETIDILSFFEREAGQIRVDIIDPAWLITSNGFEQSRLQDGIKRTFDILASFIILLIASPFLIMTIIAIWLEDGITAPVFYSQTRVGKQGKSFKVHKFRSMRTDAEKDGAKWAEKSDNRVTRVGSFIRLTRLDEFPQILNVLNGSMSFVGPRPERPEFIDNLADQIP